MTPKTTPTSEGGRARAENPLLRLIRKEISMEEYAALVEHRIGRPPKPARRRDKRNWYWPKPKRKCARG